MTVEQDGGRSKKDKHIADRLDALGSIFSQDLPKPRIEGIAQIAADKLAELRATLDEGYLEKGPNGDVLTDAYDNFLFLRNDIFPVVKVLMERTTAGVSLGNKSLLGCRYVSEEEGGEDKVEIEIVEDYEQDYDEDSDGSFSYPRITSLIEIQEYWDQGDKNLRKSLRKFSKKTKGKLLKKFEEFVEEYAR
jgi:hypothetical protein